MAILRPEGDNHTHAQCKGTLNAIGDALYVIGGKWKLLLLRSLLLNGPQRYNELLGSVSGISAKELTRNLSELSASGLLTRSAAAPVGSSQYALTEMGTELMPTFTTLLSWGQKLLKGATNISVR